MGSPNPTLVGNVQALRPSTSQKVAYTATAGTIANAVTASIVRVVCSSDAYIAVGTSPTASASTDMRVQAGQPEYFRVFPGDKVSAVQDSAAGVLYVTEMN